MLYPTIDHYLRGRGYVVSIHYKKLARLWCGLGPEEPQEPCHYHAGLAMYALDLDNPHTRYKIDKLVREAETTVCA